MRRQLIEAKIVTPMEKELNTLETVKKMSAAAILAHLFLYALAVMGRGIHR